jgi:hypothetical protein
MVEPAKNEKVYVKKTWFIKSREGKVEDFYDTAGKKVE